MVKDVSRVQRTWHGLHGSSLHPTITLNLRAGYHTIPRTLK